MPEKHRNFDTMRIRIAVVFFFPESPDFKGFRAFIGPSRQQTKRKPAAVLSAKALGSSRLT